MKYLAHKIQFVNLSDTQQCCLVFRIFSIQDTNQYAYLVPVLRKNNDPVTIYCALEKTFAFIKKSVFDRLIMRTGKNLTLQNEYANQ